MDATRLILWQTIPKIALQVLLPAQDGLNPAKVRANFIYLAYFFHCLSTFAIYQNYYGCVLHVMGCQLKVKNFLGVDIPKIMPSHLRET